MRKPEKAPAGGLPHMPAMYVGKRRGTFLPWSHAEERLQRSRNYWICTSRPDGRPHSAPVWGFWHAGALYFGTHGDTRKAQNIFRNPNVSVHLESGDDVVILEGEATQVDEKALARELDAAARKKYGMPMVIVSGAVAFCVRPRVVLAWTEQDFPNNSTRWDFRV
jgi:hypothetical protein